MKKDTSNIIDLDSMFDNNNVQTIKESTELVAETNSIDFDDILSEWCYRLPKGYPTMVDGVFTERAEVRILNQLLEERGLQTLPLPEARVFAHPESEYVTNERFIDTFTELGFNDAEIQANPFKNVQTLKKGKKYYQVKGTSKVKSIDYQTALASVADKTTVAMQSSAYPDIYLIVTGNVPHLTEKKGESATDTDVKEGMVVLFYYSDIAEAPTETNLSKIVRSLLKQVDSIPDSSLTGITRSKIKKFLTKLSAVKPKAAAKVIMDFWSSAMKIKQAGYSAPKYAAIRTGLFDEIRSVASALTGLFADKWCPGDIYLVNVGKLGAIQQVVSDVKQNMPEDGIGLLNKLFIDEWGGKGIEKAQGIVAVSLKEEKAQAGKAKQYLQTLSRKDLTYNVSSDEFGLSTAKIGQRVNQYRDFIAALSKKSDIKIILNQDKGTTGMDEKKLREKFASLKLTYFLLGEKGQDIDNNILGAVAFGMSLSGVNPTFWKIVGSSTGDAKISEFPAGSAIHLLDGGLNSKKSTITIVDKNSNNSVRFEMRIRKGEHDHEVVLNARSNGGKQATLEIVKDKQL